MLWWVVSASESLGAPGAGNPGSALLMSWKQAGCYEQQRDKHSHHGLEAADHFQLLIHACTHLGMWSILFSENQVCCQYDTHVKEILNTLHMIQSWGLVNHDVYSLS